MQWYNEPKQWTRNVEQFLEVKTDPKTDFWQKTHYGFIRDNGHFYYANVAGNFEVSVMFSAEYNSLYDQAGLMIRADESNWMKCGVEYVNGVQQASAVVTRDGYSDWSVTPLSTSPKCFKVRVLKEGDSAQVFYSLPNGFESNAESETMIRMAHVKDKDNHMQVGLMCASPDGDGFKVHFEKFSIRAL